MPVEDGFELEFAEVAGLRPCRLPLGSCVDVRFERVVPVRSFRWTRGEPGFPGWWWFATTGELVGYESWLERDRLALLDYDPRVVGWPRSRSGCAGGPWPGGEVHAGQGNTQLVDVLLWEGETETALAAAERGGCDRGAWLRLARARAATYPAASIPILVREIDLARSGASDRRAYGAVARLVRELGTWHQRAGTDDAYRTYALRLRQEHRNRPAFQDELNLAGVPRL